MAFPTDGEKVKILLEAYSFTRIRTDVNKQTVFHRFLKEPTRIYILRQFRPQHASIHYTKLHINVIYLSLVGRVA